MSDDLIQSLHHPDSEVRWNAAYDLRDGYHPEAIPDLVRLCLHDPDEDVRREATWTLGIMGRQGPVSHAALITALDHADSTVRARAAQALGRLTFEIDDPANNPLTARLVTLTRDDDPRVREHAASALMKSGDARLIEPLRTLLDDPDPAVRHVAKHAVSVWSDE